MDELQDSFRRSAEFIDRQRERWPSSVLLKELRSILARESDPSDDGIRINAAWILTALRLGQVLFAFRIYRLAERRITGTPRSEIRSELVTESILILVFISVMSALVLGCVALNRLFAPDQNGPRPAG